MTHRRTADNSATIPGHRQQSGSTRSRKYPELRKRILWGTFRHQTETRNFLHQIVPLRTPFPVTCSCCLPLRIDQLFTAEEDSPRGGGRGGTVRRNGTRVPSAAFVSGAPCKEIDLPWKQKGLDKDLWSKLVKWHSKGYLFGTSCGRESHEISSALFDKVRPGTRPPAMTSPITPVHRDPGTRGLGLLWNVGSGVHSGERVCSGRGTQQALSGKPWTKQTC